MDSKAIIAGIAFVAMAGMAAFGIFYLISNHDGETTRAVTAEGQFDFTEAKAQTQTRTAIPAAKQESARMQSERPAAQGSSLGFIRPEIEMAAASGASGPSRSAAESAAAGDASGVLQGIREDPGEVPGLSDGSLSDRAIRSLMQDVVDKVHELQPRWYKEFLANKKLKAIADRYDGSSDFKGFLKELGNSSSFDSMLRAKYKTDGMKKLTKTLLKSRDTGPQLKRLMLQEAKNPDVVPLIGKYGQAAGLPPDLVKGAQVLLKLTSSKPKGKTVRRARPTLQKREFGGTAKPGAAQKGATPPSGLPAGFDPSQLPPGVDPQELLKQYQGQQK